MIFTNDIMKRSKGRKDGERMKALLIANGTVENTEFYQKRLQKEKFGLVVCADGGIANAKRLGIRPDFIIGDFDSIDQETLKVYRRDGVSIERHLPEKDETDTELALQFILNKGADSIVMLGCTGSRFDHTLANVYLLKELLKHQVEGVIVDPHNEIRMIDKTMVLTDKENQTISLLPVEEKAEGITLEGFQYPLKDETLRQGLSRGISNKITASRAVIDFKKGLLLVIEAKD